MAIDINELLKEANLTDEQKAALQSALADQTVAKRLEEGYLRQSDYSRQMAELNKAIQKNNAYYQQLTEWQQNEQARLSQFQAELDANHQGSDAGNDTGNYLSKAEFETQLKQQLAQVQTGALQFFPILNNTSMEYYAEFGKVLDTQAVINKAKEEGTSFRIAYERYIQPERQAKAEKEMEERIKREREEAKQEALAQMRIPAGNMSTTFANAPTHVLDIVASDPSAQYGWRVAAEAHTKDAMAGKFNS